MTNRKISAYKTDAALVWEDELDDEWVMRHGMTWLAWFDALIDETDGQPRLTQEETLRLGAYIEAIRYGGE